MQLTVTKNDALGLPSDLTGKRVLSIGKSAMADEMARFGASVSNVCPDEIADLASGSFDMAVWIGQWGADKSPVVTLESVNRAMVRGGLLFAQGRCLTNPSLHAVPVSVFNEDGTQLPNTTCVLGWMKATGFDVIHDVETDGVLTITASPVRIPRSGVTLGDFVPAAKN